MIERETGIDVQFLRSVCENLLWSLDRINITSADEDDHNFVDTNDLVLYWRENV
jgi:hypothetical protein